MAILEEEVWVGLAGKNQQHFESIGYIIPKKKNKHGHLTTPRGTKILVKVSDLTDNSTAIVTKICDSCGKVILNQYYGDVILQRIDGKDICHDCGVKKGHLTKRNNVKYEKSLEYYALTNNKEYLIDEFSNKNQRKPNNTPYSTKDEYLWNCLKCGSEYSMCTDRRTNGNSNCPYCNGKRVNITNCMATTYPDKFSLLKNKQRGYEITAGHNGYEIFVCQDCGYEQKKQVNNVVRHGFKCNKCSDGVSYCEKFMFNFLEQLSLDFDTQVNFNWAKDKKYDFYIKSLNIIIETHGDQHYSERYGTFASRTLEEEQENDILKKQLAFDNGIKNYIIIDCRKSEMEYIKKSIVSSELSKIFNLNNANWKLCHEHACKSLVRTACDMWNSGITNTLDIGNILKLGRLTVTKYLKQGNLLGWCNYDPAEEIKKTAFKNNEKRRNKIIQLTKNNVFVKEWDSVALIEKELGIDDGNIYNACKGIYKSSGGFKWMYKKDYEKSLKIN